MSKHKTHGREELHPSEPQPGEPPAPGAVPPEGDEEAVTRIEVSEEAAALVRELKSELDHAIEARKRALADFANYQKRAAENEHRAAQSGVAGVVRSLLGVLDHFDLAIGQSTKEMTVEQLLGGVRMVRDELMKVLQSHGIRRVEPSVGDEFDPNRHEAVLRQPAGDVEPGHVLSVVRSGYAMDDRVLRPARVIVAAPPNAEGGE